MLRTTVSIALLAFAVLVLAGCPRSRTPSRADAGRVAIDGAPGCFVEICNGLDDDCDGAVDEGDVCGGFECESGETRCGGACVSLRNDEANCGGCGIACRAGQRCRAGSCCTPTSTAVEKLDMLFVIDNSNSMTEEQESLAAELPRMMQILATGDLNGDGSAEFVPPVSIQMGVITTDMGTGGFVVPTCAEPNFGDDGVLRTQGNTSLPGCMAIYPSFLVFRPETGADPSTFAHDVECVARMGTGGCGFEQHLEAALKALTPSSSPTSFVMGTGGQGDRANAGFVRPDALLAVVVLTDEEDCSVVDPELFNPSSFVYSSNLNLRCFSYPGAVHPVERYVEGLLAVKSDPSHLVFGLIAGVPVHLVSGGGTPDYEAILAADLMQEMIDPGDPGRLRPSCNVPGRGLAFPPRRMVRVAQQLDAAGASATVASVCQADYGIAVRSIIDALAFAEPVFGCEP